MANVYVRSGAGGAATGADWANAYLTLAAALTAKAAGDTFWVSEDHAETAAGAKSLTSPGNDSNPCFIYCVSHTGGVPPVSADLATTATVSTTGANAINFVSGVAYIYGITFSAADAASNGGINIITTFVDSTFVFNNCALKLNTTSGTPKITIGASQSISAVVKLINTTMTFGATGQAIALTNVKFSWLNTPSALGGATFPTSLFVSAGTPRGVSAILEGVDLSALGSGKTIVSNLATTPGSITLKDCKLGNSVTVAATPGANGAADVNLVRSDSSGTNYRSEKYQYTGTETVETTIVRTGGATDGTTPIAKKIVTTANSKWALPFEAIPIAIWNDSTSSITVTVYGISAGALNNDDIWMDVEYLGAAGSPQGSFATTTKADGLAAGSALTSDSSTWGGSTTKFKMSATFTPAQKGAIYIYVKAAKASTTFYIDPKPDAV